MPGLPVHHYLPGFTQTHVHQVGDAIQPFHRLLSPSPPAPNPSQHQGLFHESSLHMRWPKYWNFSFSTSHSNELPGLISFRMDWLDLLAVQGTLKSLLQHHSSKASILWCSAFFTVQFSHPYSSKVAQSFPTICYPMDSSLPGSSVHGILQARVLEWVAISFSRDLPNPGIEPRSPTLQADALLSEPAGKPI